MLSTFALLTLLAPLQSPTPYGTGVTVHTWLKTTTRADGTPLAFPAGKAEVSMAEVVLPPGSETGWHRHDLQVLAFVVEGSLEIESAKGTRVRYEAGQAIVEMVGVGHNGRNVGRGPVRLLVAYCGTPGAPLSVKTDR